MEARPSQLRWLALLAATAVALYGCWLLLRPFMGVLTWAVVLVVTFRPVHRRLAAWTARPVLSALSSTAAVVLVILMPVALVVFVVAREVPGLATGVQDVTAALLDPDSAVSKGLQRLGVGPAEIEEIRQDPQLAEPLRNLGEEATRRALGMAGGVGWGIVQVFFVIFATYYLFRDGDRIAGWLTTVLPMEPVQGAEILRRTREMIDASVYGVIVLAVLQGTLGGLAFWALGLPNPALWGAVMVVLSTIPVTGAFLVWVPAAVYLAATGSWGRGLALAAFGALVISTVDNLLRPKVMGQKARMHELLLFFSVLGGLLVFGAAGLVLGPVVVAVAFGLLDVVNQTKEGLPPEAIRQEPGLAEQTAQIADAGGAGEATGPHPRTSL